MALNPTLKVSCETHSICNRYRLWIIVMVWCMCFSQFPQASAQESYVQSLAKHYEQDCRRSILESSMGERDDKVSMKDHSLVYEVKLAKNTVATIYHTNFVCGKAPAEFSCGSGGCPGHLIINDRVYDYFAHAPFSIELEGRYLLIFPQHGTWCRTESDEEPDGSAPCFSVVTWHEGKLLSMNRVLKRSSVEGLRSIVNK